MVRRTMPSWFWQLDRLIRGESTRWELLRRGSIDISLGSISVMAIVLGSVAGACMGAFSLTGSGLRLRGGRLSNTFLGLIG